MRLFILSFFSGQVERGVEVYVSELYQKLKGKLNIKLITSKDIAEKVKPYSGAENPFLRRLYLDQTSLQIKKQTQLVLNKIKPEAKDIIYPVNNGWQSLLCKKFALKHQLKLVLAGHSGPGWDDRVNLWLNPDIFIAFSSNQARWARRQNRQVRLKTISHGVDTKKFSPAKVSKKLKLPKPIFVCVSALSPRGRGGLLNLAKARAGETNKNIEATIKAIATLKQGSLLLIGTGQDAARLDSLASKLLGPKRYQRISVSHNIIAKYYQVADVFTLASSSSESFGLVYLEALACNLPVVATDDKLRREIIGSAGLFIKDPQNPKEYSQALSQASQKKWGNIPRLQAQKLSWDNIALKYLSLFR